MGWFDGFPFKSKTDMEKERKEFEKRVFPLGPPEREAISALLEGLLQSSRKVKANEKLYAFISAKDKFTRAEDPAEAIEAARAELHKQNWLPVEDRALLLALVRLETGIDTLADMPTPEQIRALAQRE